MLIGGAPMDPLYEETLPVPRAARLPIELRPPAGFDLDDPATWPDVEGRLEYVDGRLLYMPPCGEEQQVVVAHLVFVLVEWAQRRPEFDVGANEAGMKLDRDVRAADAAVWPRPDPKARRARRFRRTAPLLAVEVAGGDEGDDEHALREKASWYLGHGTQIVWLILPESREVVVLRKGHDKRYGSGETIAAEPELPGLEAEVNRFFAKLPAAT
jgi:Uma2 family endonuclease